MADFAEFLKEHRGRVVSGEQMFWPGRYTETPEVVGTPWSSAQPLTADELDEVEASLGALLPIDYRVFMQTIGPGIWASALLCPPRDLRLFDEPLLEIYNFTRFGFNVDGCGNYAGMSALKPTEIYFLCHDPFGYAVVGKSFEEYIRRLTEHTIERGESYSFHFDLSPFTEVEYPRADKPSKPWWQFWRQSITVAHEQELRLTSLRISQHGLPGWRY